MIDIQELIEDPDFAQAFQIERQSPVWDEGAYTTIGTVIDRIGVVQPAGAEALRVLPEGELDSHAIEVWCKQDLIKGDGNLSSDVVLWNAGRYRLDHAENWLANGYWYAVGVKL
jgi:hypothetical protein